jgi:hypothetical protein
METSSKAAGKSRGWYCAFVISWIGILVIPFYNSAEPTWAGFPMFYWYQFVLVVVSALITWFVHVMTPQVADPRSEDAL